MCKEFLRLKSDKGKKSCRDDKGNSIDVFCLCLQKEIELALSKPQYSHMHSDLHALNYTQIKFIYISI